jgi:hypothetical protein
MSHVLLEKFKKKEKNKIVQIITHFSITCDDNQKYL